MSWRNPRDQGTITKFNNNNKSDIQRDGRFQEQDSKHEDQDSTYTPGYKTSLLSNTGREGL